MARTRLSVALALCFVSSAVAADIFSPGELAEPHKHLEGLKNCTQCHAAGKQLSPDRCLACHAEIQKTIDERRGLHGKLGRDQGACESCHHEHQGRDFALVGLGDPKEFDHERSGWPLRGAHARTDCAKCHDPRLVSSDAVKKLLATKKPAATFLGLQTACISCHADEHRGQEGKDCQRCHTEKAWKPATRFDHAKSAFPLRGAHVKVACDGCHKTEQDKRAAAFPPLVHPEVFTRFKPVAHESCTSCHQDPHQGRFGARCTDCHTETSWTDEKRTQGKGPRAFHAKTHFPLLGAHEKVACKACHGPFPDGRPLKYKGLAFATCASCHADAHARQLKQDCAACHTEKTFAATTMGKKQHAIWPLEGGHASARCTSCHVEDASLRSRSKAVFRMDGSKCSSCHADAHAGAVSAECTACHSVHEFKPAHYELEQHATWPLQGAHAAVACVLCHGNDEKLAAKVKQQKHKGRGPWVARASLVSLHPVQQAARCESCHQDVHRGAFGKAASCDACHSVETFHGGRFDHGKTRFPLEGRHASAQCAACHASAVLFKKVDASCASCHADSHAGQLGNDCARCHGAEKWDASKFHHDAVFPLDGRHAVATCDTCHPKVEVAPGVKTVLYKPRPLSCEGCHADFHRGAFRRWSR